MPHSTTPQSVGKYNFYYFKYKIYFPHVGVWWNAAFFYYERFKSVENAKFHHISRYGEINTNYIIPHLEVHFTNLYIS